MLEREWQLLQRWNETKVPYPDQHTIQELFEQQVATRPQKTAVRVQGQSYSYEEIDRRANQLAHLLRAKGCGSGTFIGVVLEQTVEMVTTILAILKAGAAYVPIDVDFPQSRIEYVLRDSAPAVVVTISSLLARLGDYQGSILVLDQEQEQETVIAYPTESPEITNTADDVAYIIYTSGSTGEPKGALLHHRAVSNLIMAQADVYELHSESRVLQFGSVSFDISVMEIFGALLRGGTLVLAPTEELRDPAMLCDLLTREKITFVFVSPSMLSHLPIDAGPYLELISAGGEVCPPHLAEAWSKRAHFINVYGPTEATVNATVWSSKRDGQATSPLPIGRPLPNSTVYLLDENMNPVSIGEIGEVYIGGAGVGLGYWNRPELTAERFLPSPFQAGERLYKSGDLGRFRPDGLLDFMGRIDHQVKIRGHRIEIGEIEAVLGRHEAVREAVVTARPDEHGEMRLVAYLVLAEEVDKSEIWNAIRKVLPTYMLPSAMLIMPEFPIMPTGKVDRKALPEPSENDGFSTEFVPPRNPVEREVAEIWQEMLGLERVGIHDHFLEIGGHSLLMTQLLLRIEQRFGTKFPRREVFLRPTIAEFCELLSDEEHHETSDTSIPVLPKGTGYELSHVQKRMWHLAQIEPELSFYNVPMYVRITGTLDVQRFQTAFQTLLDRHAIFRTTYEMQAGHPIQLIHEQMNVEVGVRDWSMHTEAERERLLHEFQAFEAERIFDLQNGPLFVVELVQLASTEYVFLLNAHHILIDGWSMNLVVRELDEVYRALSQGQEPQLPALPVQYADYAAWHNQWTAGPEAALHRDFWRNHLSGTLPLLELPTDFPRPPVQSHRGAMVSQSLHAELVSELRTICRDGDLTLYMLGLAAFQVLLHRYCGQDDLIVGTPMGGRSHSDVERLIGMFVNTVAVRTDLSNDPRFVDVLAQVKETVLEAFDHQEYPFDRVVEELDVTRDRSRNPVFSVMFIKENVLEHQHIGDLQVKQIDGPVITSKFDLTLFLRDDGEGVSLNMEYSLDLFTEQTIQRMLANLQELLCAITKDPSTPLSQLSVVAADERRRLTYAGQSVQEPNAEMLCMQERFEAQVTRNPHRVAVSLADQHLTYAEVNERANQLAHTLRARGVGPETPVVLLMDRSVEMVVAILGVGKSGGVYIPLDPDFPESRVRYVLDNSQAQVVITQPQYEQRFASFAGELLIVDEQWSRFSGERVDNPMLVNTVEDLFYILYTSGSTGEPKGVMLTHRNFGRLVDVTEPIYGFGEDDVFTLFHSYCFDVSVWEMQQCLLHGGRLVVVPKETAQSPERFHALLKQEQVTVLNQTPSAFYQLMEIDSHLGGESVAAGLRYVILAGEAVNVERLRPWLERDTGRPQLFNMYGPTETIHATCHHIQREDLDQPSRGSVIGKPLADLKFYLLDGNRQLVPQGVTGEIYVAGPGVARSYFHLPEKTAAVFVDSPLPECAGERWYKTGDLARWNERGELEYLGRIDDQVKIRGYRMELGEIEAVFAKYPQVRNCAVMARRAADGELQVVAYVETDEPRSSAEWRGELKQHLPAYMIPAHIVSMRELPLSRNGKVDRGSLPEPALGMEPSDAYVAPQNEEQVKMAAAWQEVLGARQVGICDDFFMLGGHSLNILPIVVRVKQEFPGLMIQDFYTYRTIGELTQALKQREAGQAVASVSVATSASVERKAVRELVVMPEIDWEKVEFVQPREILLTGATGFLGAHVLQELLLETEAHVTCLIRQADGQEPKQRLREILRFYFGESVLDSVDERVTVVAGDLAVERFGVEPEVWKQVQERIDTVIHCGADVRHYGAGEHFAAVNVRATEQLLELARKQKGVRFHHVSTLGIAGSAQDDGAEYRFEERDFDRGQVLENVYAHSKFQAEKCVREAIREGVPATVYRVGNLVGHSKTGQFQINMDSNAFYRMTKAMVLVEAGAEDAGAVDLTPVDYGARALVHLVNQREAAGQTYHLCNPQQLSSREWMEHLRAFGYALKGMSWADYETWLLHEGASGRYQEALQLLIAQLEEASQTQTVIQYECAETVRVLMDGGIHCPAPDRELVFAMLRYAVEAGYFPQPVSIR